MSQMYNAKDNRYDAMRYHNCGKSGLKLPEISFGLWHNFGDDATENNVRDMLTTAFDLGITHMDIANNYGPPPGYAEEIFGRIMRSNFTPYRDELTITRKSRLFDVAWTLWRMGFA